MDKKLQQHYELYWNVLMVQYKKFGRKGLIDSIINVYKDNYPINYKKFCDACKTKRRYLKNEFADAGDPNFEMRQLYALPKPVRTTCQKIINRLPNESKFEETLSERKWLWENYPQFRVAKKY